MDRHIALTLVLLGSMQLTAATEQKELLVHFEKDSASLDEQATEELDAFLTALSISGDYHFSVEGHTDSDGSLAFNDDLAASRASTVRAFLVQHGADPALVDIDYRGERSPVASNASRMGMASNRRVRIIFTRNVFANTEELREALRSGCVQQFTIDPGRDNLISGQAGATVRFSANAFQYDDGRAVQTPVTVEFTEALGALQMVAFGLSTRSNDHLLETDGMVKVTATDTAGNTLRLNRNAPMTLTMPAEQTKPRMQLFLSETGTDWTVAATPGDVAPQLDRVSDRPIALRIVRDLPVYKEDLRGKPLKPGIPVLPKPPSPRVPFASHRPWWGVLRPGLMQEREQRGQAQADKRKEEVERRYRKRVDKYWADKKDFPATMERYDRKKATWDSLKRVEYVTWQTEVYEPARLRFDSIQGLLDAPYRANMAAWKARQDSIRQRHAQWADTVRTVTSSELSNYVYTTSQLGWINCDRFYEVSPERKAPVIARSTIGSDAHAYVVFTGMRMLLNMEPRNQGRHASPPVPMDEPAVIFAFSVKDGQPQLCVEPVVRGEMPVLEFKPSTVAELGRRLAELAGT